MGWVESEFETIDLGDSRLNRRSITIIETLGLAPGRSIPQAFQSWGEIKAAYNFFSNELVSNQKLIRPHLKNTVTRIKEYPVVLLPSDTTDIDYTTKKAMRGKERLSNKKSGLWLHLTMAVTPNRLNLGVIEANFWNRNPEVSHNSSTIRNSLPIEEKESYRWLQSYKAACEIAREVPQTHIINMTDREGDIVEIFAESVEQMKQTAYADFIIRSKHDRVIKNSGEKKLRQKLKKAPSLGEVEFTIPPTKKRVGRKVKQELKAVQVILNPKRLHKAKIKINALMAVEKDPPENESALIWIFITSLPINNFEDVSKIIGYYLSRWEIELFFKILKSACKIEDRQLQLTDRIKSLIIVFLVLGWRIMFTMMLGRVCPNVSCGDLFVASEWKAVYKIINKNKTLPKSPPTLGKFIEMVAKLGGYIKRKNGGPPGIKVMWKGMARMVDFSIAWEAFGR